MRGTGHMGRLMPFALALALAAQAGAQTAVGFQKEFADDFNGTARELKELAQAMPADKYGWRPGEGVRSVGEVYVHVAAGNFLLLALAGVKPPAEYYKDVSGSARERTMALYKQTRDLESVVTKKDDVVKMLNESLDAVRTHLAGLSAADLDRETEFFGEKTTVRRIYLRILAHTNEHLGQSIAYARMNGVTPPWSQPHPPAQGGGGAHR